MNIKTFLLSTLAGGIVFFLLGWAQYSLLAGSVYPDMPETCKNGMGMMMTLILIGCLISAAVYSFIFLRWANIATFKSGMKAAAILGFLLSLSMNLFMTAGGESCYYKVVNFQNVVIDILLATIFAAIVGGIIAFVIGKLEKK